jgi:hypothetical protein
MMPNQKDMIHNSITLNHEKLEVGTKGYKLKPVFEVAYIVSPHIIMTKSNGHAQLPDDGIISGTNTRVWLYLIHRHKGIKVFLVDEELEVSNKAPGWVQEFYPSVALILAKHGGWKRMINRYKKEAEENKRMWKTWTLPLRVF